jgi:hypothetical protein
MLRARSASRSGLTATAFYEAPLDYFHIGVRLQTAAGSLSGTLAERTDRYRVRSAFGSFAASCGVFISARTSAGRISGSGRAIS